MEQIIARLIQIFSVLGNALIGELGVAASICVMGFMVIGWLCTWWGPGRVILTFIGIVVLFLVGALVNSARADVAWQPTSFIASSHE